MGGVTKETIKAADNKLAYEEAKPEQFGNLHERMQYLMKLIHDHEGIRDDVPSDVCHAIYDLETELKHYETKPYSFGRGQWIKPGPVNKS